MLKTRQTCRVCGNNHLVEVLDLGAMYSQGAFIKEGVPTPPYRKIPNQLVRCDVSKNENACGALQTRHSVDPKILYANYWYQSGISKTMKDHLKSIVDECISIIKPLEGYVLSVLDIAMNDGTLLKCYPDNYIKSGIDPSDITKKVAKENPNWRVINSTFPSSQLDDSYDFSIITSIACYYDVEDPKSFAQEIKKHLSPNGIWVFEVAYLPVMIKNLSFDSICVEHLLSYHLAPLEKMFSQIGLKLFDARETSTNGGSIMCFVCRDDCSLYDTEERSNRLTSLRVKEFDLALDEGTIYENFKTRIIQFHYDLSSKVNSIQRDGQTIHLYGASTKLNTILGYVGIGPDKIKYAAERSPEKWGAKTISGIEILSEEQSRAMKPDYYLVGPYHFKKEILQREKETILNGTSFIFPLPKVTIVNKDNLEEHLSE